MIWVKWENDLNQNIKSRFCTFDSSQRSPWFELHNNRGTPNSETGPWLDLDFHVIRAEFSPYLNKGSCNLNHTFIRKYLFTHSWPDSNHT